MKELEEYFVNNKIYTTTNVGATFGKVLEKYKFQEIALIGDDVSALSEVLRKDYKITSVNLPKELCYSLCGLNLSRIQIKENTRLLVAYGSQHFLNLVKLIANKLNIAYCYVAKGNVNIYAKTHYAIMDNTPIYINAQDKGIIIDESARFEISDAYSQIIANIFGCFENYLRTKFFEESIGMNTKKIFETYYEILNIDKLKSQRNTSFMLKLNLLQVIQYSKHQGVPFHDSYYLTLQFLTKNVHLFDEFDKISFLFSQMLCLLYDMFFNNQLQSPLYVMLDDLEKMTTIHDYTNAISRTQSRNCEKIKYVYNVYINMLCNTTASFQRLYQKTAFKLKTLIKDSGYELYNKLDCEKMINTIKETSLLNPHSLLSKFGITELA